MRKLILILLCAAGSGLAIASDADNGKQLAQAKGCIACHQLDGQGTTDLYPNLGGQHAPYLSSNCSISALVAARTRLCILSRWG